MLLSVLYTYLNVLDIVNRIMYIVKLTKYNVHLSIYIVLFRHLFLPMHEVVCARHTPRAWDLRSLQSLLDVTSYTVRPEKFVRALNCL